MRSRGAWWAHFYLYGTLLFLRGGAGAHIPCPFCAAGSISAPCGLRLGPEWDRSITWARGYWGGRLTLTARALLCPTLPPPWDGQRPPQRPIAQQLAVARPGACKANPCRNKICMPSPASPFDAAASLFTPTLLPGDKNWKKCEVPKFSSHFFRSAARTRAARSTGPTRLGHPAGHAPGF